MESPVGSDPADLKQCLLVDPASFDFLQCVRLLRLLAPERPLYFAAAAVSTEPGAMEALFERPRAEVIGVRDLGEAGLRVIAPVLALAGPMGVLPGFYTEFLASEALRVAETTDDPPEFRHLLDLFEHRLIALYYAILEKSCPPLGEEALLHGLPRAGGLGMLGGGHEAEPAPSEIVLSLLGFGTSGLTPDPAIPMLPPLTLCAFAPSLLALNRSTSGFAEMLTLVFGMEATISDRQPRWRALTVDPGDGLGGSRGCLLGQTTLLGDSVWDSGSAIRVRLSPVGRELAAGVLGTTPLGGHMLPALRRLATFYFNGTVDILLELDLAPETWVPLALGEARGPYAPLLGISAWIESRLNMDNYSVNAQHVCTLWLLRDDAPDEEAATRETRFSSHCP